MTFRQVGFKGDKKNFLNDLMEKWDTSFNLDCLLTFLRTLDFVYYIVVIPLMRISADHLTQKPRNK